VISLIASITYEPLLCILDVLMELAVSLARLSAESLNVFALARIQLSAAMLDGNSTCEVIPFLYNDTLVTETFAIHHWQTLSLAAYMLGFSFALLCALSSCGRDSNEVRIKPRECIACHKREGDWEEHQTAGHANVDCQTCHMIVRDHYRDPDAKSGEGRSPEERLLLKIAGEEGEEHRIARRPILIREAECRQCHATVAERSTGHGLHAGTDEFTCMACHSGRIHRFKPPYDACASCHISVVAESSGMAKVHCTSCHGFHRDKDGTQSLLPSRDACLSCHLKTQPKVAEEILTKFFSDAKHAAISCGECHTPHGGVDARAESPCARCHPVGSLGGTPPHNWEFHLGDCTVCHQPHNFAPEAATVGGPEYLAMVKHEEAGSQEPKFHLTAEGKVEGGDCNSCHEFGRHTRAVSAVGHPSCASCHSESTFGYLGDRGVCGKCHTMETGAFNSLGHQSCQGCHSGHSWAGAGEGLCDRCHSGVRAKLAKIMEKSSCLTCHGAHDARTPGAPEACDTCHSDVVDEAPGGIAAKRECGSCHETHTWEYRAGSCAGCHGDVYEATPEELEFKGECLNCHTQHEWAASIDDCTTCHADAVEDAERGGRGADRGGAVRGVEGGVGGGRAAGRAAGGAGGVRQAGMHKVPPGARMAD